MDPDGGSGRPCSSPATCSGTTTSSIGEEPFPSLADVLYLAGYPFIALGLFLLIRRRLGDGDRGGLLDAAILTTAAAILSWTFLMQPQVAGTELDVLSLSISLAYPITDLLLIGVAHGPPDDAGCADRVRSGCSARASSRSLVGRPDLRPPDPRGDVRQRAPRSTASTSSPTSCSAPSAPHPSMRRLTDPHPVAVTWLGPVRLVGLAAAMLTGPVLSPSVPSADGGLPVVAAGTAAPVAARPRPPRRPRRPARARRRQAARARGAAQLPGLP